jgi:hypothetical protein
MHVMPKPPLVCLINASSRLLIRAAASCQHFENTDQACLELIFACFAGEGKDGQKAPIPRSCGHVQHHFAVRRATETHQVPPQHRGEREVTCFIHG